MSSRSRSRCRGVHHEEMPRDDPRRDRNNKVAAIKKFLKDHSLPAFYGKIECEKPKNHKDMTGWERFYTLLPAIVNEAITTLEGVEKVTLQSLLNDFNSLGDRVEAMHVQSILVIDPTPRYPQIDSVF